MKHKKNDHQNQNLLAKHFGKKYGEFVYSGALAIEASLKILSISTGDYVVIPNNICYRVLLAIVRLGAIPIIISPINGLTISAIEITEILRKYRVKAVIAVHNFGYLCQINDIRKVCGNEVFIIEDAAQVWNPDPERAILGKNSDIVITSFAKNKPFSFGIGAGIFSNDPMLSSYFDHLDQFSRESKNILIPYILPDITCIDIEKKIPIANKLHDRKVNIFKMIISRLQDNTQIIFPGIDSTNCYIPLHKLPIRIKNILLLKQIINLCKKMNIKYELPHKHSLDQLHLAKQHNAIYVDYFEGNDYNLVIKIGINTVPEMKRWLTQIEKKLL